jgi:hypothetical protein
MVGVRLACVPADYDPVFGQHEYTHALVGDLEREGAEYMIVDNGVTIPRSAMNASPPPTKIWAGSGEATLGSELHSRRVTPTQ